jgi:hypothetical protein
VCLVGLMVSGALGLALAYSPRWWAQSWIVLSAAGVRHPRRRQTTGRPTTGNHTVQPNDEAAVLVNAWAWRPCESWCGRVPSPPIVGGMSRSMLVERSPSSVPFSW